ncbi:ABC transporter ATP-binding protein [Candidatus Izimaplasma bacterium ZiA1]|uniref:sugar ABC transporter ATP-binding protein n=1 Tax=Candidatus Izimoplasma sp. ZiA1 TaxID=2024899 RepID=UPI000BAA6A8C|nr:ABC transporter ATP-binding protein [Candidatus Izimaplasma bacterium ZiA1]
MKNILEMKGITKEFPGVKALDNVNFEVKTGEIHCLVGENGAGKSTLMKVLSGVYKYGEYSGDIVFENKVRKFKNIKESEQLGISIIYQELALIPEMTIYENIFLGHEIKNKNIINWNETITESKKYLDLVNLKINPSEKVINLGVGQQQLIEIAKALSKDVKLLILDEPTAALNEEESDNLLKLLLDLKEKGVTSIMISHKLKEVTAIADTVTILRDGKTICSLSKEKNEINKNKIITEMVGREINDVFPKRKSKPFDEVCLEVKNINAYNHKLRRQVVKDASFYVKKGEVVGIAGLMGAGRTELAHSIFGNPYGYQVSGEVLVEGKNIDFSNPKKAIKAKIAYVSEDRKGNGLILMQDIKQNISLANLQTLTKGKIINNNQEIMIANKYKDSINIKTPSIEQKVNNLSGGNQQKVSISKWLFSNPKVLILDEPTRGIDVGAKFEIYTLINELISSGLSIVLISSELPEILGMSDRVYVLNEGRIAGELPIEEANQENIIQLATE